MRNEGDNLQRPSKAQKTFAIALVTAIVAAIAIGGWYLGRTYRGAPSSAVVESGRGGSVDAIRIGNLSAQLRGDFQTPSSEVTIEFKNSEEELVDVGEVKLALDMPMPGMQMHEDAKVSGRGGRYTVKVRPQMAGDWRAKLSFSGPQGSGERTFPVTVKRGR